MKLARAILVTAAALLAAAGAQARDNVYWSVGIEAAPGVTLGVGNTRPVVVAPAPIYMAPQPIYVAPQPVVVYPRGYYVQPAPVYYAGGPVYYAKPKKWKKHHHGWRH
jgi:hypothetical protein